MKRTFKKAVSVFLVCVLLPVSMPVQSFAAFESIKAPVIQEIKIKDTSDVVSLKEVEEDILASIEFIEECFGRKDEDILSTFELFLTYDLGYADFNYDIEVTLASGETYNISAADGIIEYNSIYTITVACFITYADYLEAKEKGAEEIKATVSGEVYNNLLNDSLKKEYTTTQNLPLVDMIVKSITPLTELPKKYYADSYYYDMEGTEFLIEYADGSTVTAKAERNDSDKSDAYLEIDNYILNGRPLTYYYNTKHDNEATAVFTLEYVDASYKKDVEYIEGSLFKGVEITDYAFNTDTAQLSSISYNLTYNDGTVKSLTKEITAEPIDLVYGVEIDAIDGYVVVAYIGWGNGEINNTPLNADNYFVGITVGEHTDDATIDNPNNEVAIDIGLEGNIFTNLLDFIKTILFMIFKPILFFF